MVSAIEMEISEDRIAGRRYVDMSVEIENEDEPADSKKKEFTEKMLLNPTNSFQYDKFWQVMCLQRRNLELVASLTLLTQKTSVLEGEKGEE